MFEYDLGLDFSVKKKLQEISLKKNGLLASLK